MGNKLLRHITIAALVFTSQAHAASYSGNDLQNGIAEFNKLMSGDKRADVDRIGLALGYIRGATDTLSSIALICPPSGSNVNQMVQITKKYLDENPALLHQTAALLVTSAAREAFPCKK